MSKNPKSTPENDLDRCTRCGRLTDSIMQSNEGMVCESCLGDIEEEDEMFREYDDGWEGNF
jgi:hypothetical protein